MAGTVSMSVNKLISEFWSGELPFVVRSLSTHLLSTTAIEIEIRASTILGVW